MAVETIGQAPQARNGQVQSSLGTTAARNLATTTKTSPQMQGITNRWVQRILPWVEVKGGTYRVNRRVSYAIGDGRVAMTQAADRVSIVPGDLAEFPALRDYDDADVLTAMAGRFTQREIAPSTVVVQAGTAIDAVFVIAHGRVARLGENQYGEQKMLGVLADGEYFGTSALTDARATVGRDDHRGDRLHAPGARPRRTSPSWPSSPDRSVITCGNSSPRRASRAPAAARRPWRWPRATPVSRSCRPRSWTTRPRRGSTSCRWRRRCCACTRAWRTCSTSR